MLRLAVTLGGAVFLLFLIHNREVHGEHSTLYQNNKNKKDFINVPVSLDNASVHETFLEEI